MASPDRSRSRFWLLYAASWTPFVAIYAVVIARRGAPLVDALLGSISNVAPAALLGALVWLYSERHGERGDRRLVFVLRHAVFAIAYSAAWTGAIVASIYIAAPRAVFDDFARFALGWQYLSGLTLYAVIAGIATATANARRLREQEAAATRSEALRVRAELQALRAQLDPHFLFNTLHSLMALVRTDQRAAESALERLGDLLRYVLDVNRDALDEVPVADEWAFVRNYVELEQLRLGTRLRVVDELDPDSVDCLIPAFTLQPLVENAVRHGIATQPHGGTLIVRSRLANDMLVLDVVDDGPGADPGTVARGTGVGLRAVRQRLETRFGARARFAIKTAPGAGFGVTVSLPAHTAIGATPAAIHA